MSSIEEISEYTSIIQEGSDTAHSEDQEKTEKPLLQDSTSKSIVFSSCEDGDLSNEEGENKDSSEVSSTKEIFIHDFKEASRVPIDERNSSQIFPKKRTSDCSKLGFHEKMKIFKGTEGTDDSFESICHLPVKVRLKRNESDFSSKRRSGISDESHSSYKSRLGGTSSQKSKHIESDVDRSRYSDSIFKVLLKPPPEKIIKKKLVPVEHSSRNRISALYARSPVSSIKQITSSNRVSEDDPMALSSEDALSDVASSAFSDDTDTTDDRGDVLQNCKSVFSPSEMAMKSVGSKRSVHWEDEVTMIRRNTSSNHSQVWENELVDNPIHLQNNRKYINLGEISYRDNLSTNSNEKGFKINSESRKKKKFTDESKDSIFCSQQATNKSDNKRRSNKPDQNMRQLASDSEDEDGLYSNHINSFYKNQKDSSSADIIIKNVKYLMKKSKNSPSSETISSSDKPFASRKKFAVSSLKRGYSSPNFNSKRGTNNIVKNVDSSVDLKKSRGAGAYNGSNTSGITKKSGLKYQGGEKDFQRESECHYEDIRVPSDKVQEPLVKRKLSTSKAKDHNSVKSSKEDQSQITTESLRDCLFTIKNLSSHSQNTQPEHIKIIQEIQCNIVNINEQIERNSLKDKMEFNSTISNVEDKNILLTTNDDKKKPINRFNPTKKASNGDKGVSKTKSSREDNPYDGSTETRKSIPSTANSERSLKITESWRNTEIAIKKRRQKMLAEFHQKRNDVQSDSPKEFLKTSKLLTKIKEKRNILKTDNGIAKNDLREPSESNSPDIIVEDFMSMNNINNFDTRKITTIDEVSKDGGVGINLPIAMNVYSVGNMDDKKKSEENVRKDVVIIEKIVSDNTLQSIQSPDNIEEDDSGAQQKNGANVVFSSPGQIDAVKEESAKDESVSSCKQFVLVGQLAPRNESFESVELDAALHSNDKHFVSMSSESDSEYERERNTSTVGRPAGSRLSRKDTFTPPRPPSRKPFFDRVSDCETEESTLSVVRIQSQPPARSRNSPALIRAAEETTSVSLEKKDPPQPRMYSTLKESITNTNKKQYVRKCIQSAMKDLTASLFLSKAKRKECSRDSIKTFRQMKNKSEGCKGMHVKSNLFTLEKRIEWEEMVKTYQKFVRPKTETSCSHSKLNSKFLKLRKIQTLSKIPTEQPVSNPPVVRLDVKEKPGNRSSDEPKLCSSLINIPLPNKKINTSGVCSPTHSSNYSTSNVQRRSAYSEKLKRNRLLNYVPPWEKVNLTPKMQEINRNEIKSSEGPKQSKSNPQSIQNSPRSLSSIYCLSSAKPKSMPSAALSCPEDRRRDVSEHSSSNSYYDTADNNEAHKGLSPKTARGYRKHREIKPKVSSLETDANFIVNTLGFDKKTAPLKTIFICNSTQTTEQLNANNMRVNVSIRTSYSRNNLNCDR